MPGLRKPDGNHKNSRHRNFKLASDDFWLKWTSLFVREPGPCGMRAPRKKMEGVEASETRCSNYTRPHSFSGFRWKNIVFWQRGLTLCLRISWLVFGLSRGSDWKGGEGHQAMGRLTGLFVIWFCVLGVPNWLSSLLQTFYDEDFLIDFSVQLVWLVGSTFMQDHSTHN